jgi:hypothetical protein
MSSAGDVSLLVSVDDDHLDRLDDVAAELRAAGMEIQRAMPTLGTITGSVPAAHVEDIRAVKGVADVESGREVQLPPPDSPIQ